MKYAIALCALIILVGCEVPLKRTPKAYGVLGATGFVVTTTITKEASATLAKESKDTVADSENYRVVVTADKVVLAVVRNYRYSDKDHFVALEAIAIPAADFVRLSPILARVDSVLVEVKKP